MADTGYLKVYAYTARQVIPLAGAKIAVYRNINGDRELLAYRETGRDGTTPMIEIQTPSSELSLSPNNGEIKPFASVNVRVLLDGYYSVYIEDVQIFGGQTSIQNAELVPIERNVDFEDSVDKFYITPQNL